MRSFLPFFFASPKASVASLVSSTSRSMSGRRSWRGSGPSSTTIVVSPPDSGRYAKLSIDGVLYMTDTRMEKMTSMPLVENAEGRVVVFGLGLGMVLPPLLASEKVISVLVVEKCLDVVALVAPCYAHEKLSVVVGDAFDFVPEKDVRFDTVFFDIWPSIADENLDEARKLHRRFRRFVVPGGWMGSWMADKLSSRRKVAAKRRREILASVGGDPLRRM